MIMIILWSTYDHLMIILWSWSSYDLLMIILWSSHDHLMIILWSSYDHHFATSRLFTKTLKQLHLTSWYKEVVCTCHSRFAGRPWAAHNNIFIYPSIEVSEITIIWTLIRAVHYILFEVWGLFNILMVLSCNWVFLWTE